jgi:hypothetical protein
MIPTWRKQFIRYRSFLLNIVSHYRRRKDLKVYLEIFLSLATISAFSIFALRPTLITISELITEIESKKETLAIIDEKISNLGKAQQIYERERDKIELLSNVIPDSAKPDTLALQIEGISSDNQVPLTGLSIGQSVIKGVSTDQPLEEEGYNKTTFVFQTSSEYASLLQTIQSIQNLQRLLDIDSFTLGVSEETQAINLTVNGYSVFLNNTQ